MKKLVLGPFGQRAKCRTSCLVAKAALERVYIMFHSSWTDFNQ